GQHLEQELARLGGGFGFHGKLPCVVWVVWYRPAGKPEQAEATASARPACLLASWHGSLCANQDRMMAVTRATSFRSIEIGVTNRIRTGTNAFTGRDAAVTS